jgi:hypothetical protein
MAVAPKRLVARLIGQTRRPSRLLLLIAIGLCSQIAFGLSAPTETAGEQHSTNQAKQTESPIDESNLMIKTPPVRNSHVTSATASATTTTTTTMSSQTSEEARPDESPHQTPTRGAGQLESFSMEATGLGDLEEADAIRKMIRRSQIADADGQPVEVLGDTKGQDKLLDKICRQILAGSLGPRRGGAPPGVLARATGADTTWLSLSADGRDAFGLFERQLRRVLDDRKARRWQMSDAAARPPSTAATPVEPAQQGESQSSPPLISISRRTAEELNDDDDGARLNLDNDEDDDGNFGEFSSRISLLTTRKIQPQPLLVDVPIERLLRRLGVASGGQQLLILPGGGARRGLAAGTQHPNHLTTRHLTSNLDASDRKLAPSDESQVDHQANQAIMLDTSSNYLPRIARASPM